MLHMLLLFKRITAWQTLKSQSLNQTVSPLRQLCEVGICTHGDQHSPSSCCLLSGAENGGRWNHCSGGQLDNCFLRPALLPTELPKLSAPGVGPSVFVKVTILLFIKLQIVALICKLLTMNHTSTTMMFKTLIDYLLYILRPPLHLSSVINKGDIINRSRILRCHMFPFQFSKTSHSVVCYKSWYNTPLSEKL